MTEDLGKYAEIHLGFKSLLNDFFYVDQDTIDRFGIESEFLVPLYKLGDLNADRYWQHRVSPRRWFFRCEREPADLRGTGAGKYVRWGAQQTTTVRKQTKQSVSWPDAPALQHSRHWYFPAAKVNLTRIAVRKAPGQRLAPFLFKKPMLVDQRLYTVAAQDGVDWEILAAYLSSSLFALSLETNSNLSLGSGYLTLGTKALRRLPAPDLRVLSSSGYADSVKAAAAALWARKPLDANELADTPEMRVLDDSILKGLGLHRDDLAKEIELDARHFAETRLRLNELRKEDAASSETADIDAVAGGLVPEIREWLDVRRFPEDFFESSETDELSLSSGALTVEITPMLDTASLRIESLRGEVELEADVPATVAEVVLRSLQFGRRYFVYPTDPDVANKLASDAAGLAHDLEEKFSEVVSRTSLGSRYDETVKQRVLSLIGVRLSDLLIPVDHGEWLIPEAPGGS